jgi:hypothetical protein
MRLIRCALAAGCAVWLMASSASAATDRPTYALILANNTGLEPAQAPLRYADDDGARYYELFAPRTVETVLLSVMDADTQALHPGLAARTAPPTRANLREALARLNARMAQDKARGAQPVLYFVFTGHGKRGPAGEGAVSLLDGAFTRTDLYEQVLAPSTAARLHLIVDACDSYYFVNSRGALPMAPARTAAVSAVLGARELGRYPNVGAVLSTSREQESHEWSAIRSGVFSHQVLSALAGAADVNADGRVEYSELRAFIAAANQGVDDVRGRLDVSIQPPAQDQAAPLVDLADRSRLGFLLMPPGLEGRLWVEDARGLRVAELHKERERPVVLGLPPTQHYFLRAPGREAPFSFARSGSLVDAGGLAWHQDTLAARGAVEEAFGQRLFSVPFGPRFYNGFMASLGETPVAPEQEADLTP